MISHMHNLSARAESAISLGDTLTIIGIIVGLIAIFVGTWAVRKWGIRRGAALFTYQSTQLIPYLPLAARDLLKVEFRDVPVENPHLLELRLQNIGRRDIASGSFDSTRPVKIKTNTKFYGLISASHPQCTTSTALGSDGIVGISPMLLK